MTLKARGKVPFSGAFNAFPAVAVLARSNIKISEREKRKHAPAYKRDFPLYRDPAFLGLLAREAERGCTSEGGRLRVPSTAFCFRRKTNLRTERHGRVSPLPDRYGYLT